MLKKFSKIVVIVLVLSVVFLNLSFAETVVYNAEQDNEVINSETQNKKEDTSSENKTAFAVKPVNTDAEKVEEKIIDIADKGESIAYKIVEQISDKSLPVCAILILWGAVLYFILGIRNLYKKRQGLLLMWGALTFCVIAKIMNFVFWFALMR